MAGAGEAGAASPSQIARAPKEIERSRVLLVGPFVNTSSPNFLSGRKKWCPWIPAQCVVDVKAPALRARSESVSETIGLEKTCRPFHSPSLTSAPMKEIPSETDVKTDVVGHPTQFKANGRTISKPEAPIE